MKSDRDKTKELVIGVDLTATAASCDDFSRYGALNFAVGDLIVKNSP